MYSSEMYSAAAANAAAVISACARGCVEEAADRLVGSVKAPLHWASEFGRTALVEKLVERSVHVDEENDRGETSLHLAIRHNHMDTALMLIDCGSDVKARDSVYGRTLLHWSCLYGSKMMVTTLVGRGVDVNSTDKSGRTPLHMAGSALIARELLELGAFVNAVASDGETPLHSACASNNSSVARVLIDYGANLRAQDSWFRTPLEYAEMYSNQELADILRRSEASAATASARTFALSLATSGSAPPVNCTPLLPFSSPILVDSVDSTPESPLSDSVDSLFHS